MPKLTNLEDIYLEGLRDLLNAENQILKALPRMAKAATNEELQTAFEEHRTQTETHIERLEQVFESLGIKARGKKCAAMEGIIEEGKELLAEDIEEAALDAALIAAAQKVEHYEIAAYGTLRVWAMQLGFEDQAAILETTLNEEKDTDERLTMIAESIVNVEAEEGDEVDGQIANRGSNGFSRN